LGINFGGFRSNLVQAFNLYGESIGIGLKLCSAPVIETYLVVLDKNWVTNWGIKNHYY